MYNKFRACEPFFSRKVQQRRQVGPPSVAFTVERLLRCSRHSASIDHLTPRACAPVGVPFMFSGDAECD